MRPPPGNDLELGLLAGGQSALSFPRTLRDKHLYVCGGTGMGKTKFLERLVRQDVIGWRKSHCGMLVLDPHGKLYDDLINWLAWHNIDRPIIPIDLRQDDWVVAYNLLRQRQSADPAVLVDNITDAMAHVWGQSGTNQTPLFARWSANVIRALYEKNLTLIQAEHLMDHMAKQMRYAITADMSDKASRQDWRFAATLSPKEFEAQIGSTVNRLRRFIQNQTMRGMFGQPKVSLDLGRALEEGSIILVNLATEYSRVSPENVKLFATLLLSDLWTAAQDRGKRDGIKPFYVYLDEFQRFVTPTISENLDEARGYGLHLTISHQFPNQLINQGESGCKVYDSIMENASSKVVFRLAHENNLKAMAQWLFMGVMNPDEIKHQLEVTKVMSYREERREIYGESISAGRSRGSQKGHAAGAGLGGTQAFPGDGTVIDPLSTSNSWSGFSANSDSESEAFSESSSHSKTSVPMLVPVFGKELAHVQFRSLEEQVHRAMRVLFDLEERHAATRLVGMRAPVSLVTPNMNKMPGTPERTKLYLAHCYEKLPFALPTREAHKQISDREAGLAEELLKDLLAEPTTAKRRLR